MDTRTIFRCRGVRGGTLRMFHGSDRIEGDYINGNHCDARSANPQALHGHRHDATTREQGDYLPPGLRDKHQNTEEWREAKVTRVVLKHWHDADGSRKPQNIIRIGLVHDPLRPSGKAGSTSAQMKNVTELPLQCTSCVPCAGALSQSERAFVRTSEATPPGLPTTTSLHRLPPAYGVAGRA
jgi:hypothetical protein